jgi:very-short-patch-repair endonuclease
VVATWQLYSLGFSKSQVHDRAAAGWLHRVHRGVYAVGHRRLSAKGRWLAAVLACGPDAVLSHHAAVALWGLRPRVGGPVDVTVPGRRKRGQRGIRVHNVRALADVDRTVLDGIPVTSLPRTLLDYAEVARPQQLRLALEAADRRGLLDRRAIEELCARSPGRRGRGPLKSALADLSGPAPWTQSELERRFLALIRGGGLPEPHCNVVVAGHVVDFHWPRQRLVVEVDGYEYHRSREAFENDRERDAALQIAGQRVLRVTHRRIGESAALISELRALLAGASDR